MKTPEPEDGLLRYTAYLARVKPLLLASQRYLAYSSDLGEAVRPVVPPTVVRSLYGLSWSYIAYDGNLARSSNIAASQIFK